MFDEYFPMIDQELMYIMNRYTGLDKLLLKEVTVVSWPSPTISETVMEPFLRWAFGLKECCINIGGVSGESWLLNVCHSCQGTVDRRADDKREAHFILGFSQGPASHAKFHLELTQIRAGESPKLFSRMTQ